MRVSFQPIKMTRSWVYRTGSWKEATQYYTDILMNIWQKHMHVLGKNVPVHSKVIWHWNINQQLRNFTQRNYVKKTRWWNHLGGIK